jgi:hypothetical protein
MNLNKEYFSNYFAGRDACATITGEFPGSHVPGIPSPLFLLSLDVMEIKTINK